MDRTNFFVIIPPEIVYAKIPPSHKVLYGCIVGLSQKEGYCWATNQYFADILNTTPRMIPNYLGKLQENGWIRVDLEKEDGVQRKIYVTGGMKLVSWGDETGFMGGMKLVSYKYSKENNKEISIYSTIKNGSYDTVKNVVDNWHIIKTDYTVEEGEALHDFLLKQLDLKGRDKAKFSVESWQYKEAFKLRERLIEEGRYQYSEENSKGLASVLSDWSDTIDKINRLDGITPEIISSVLSWVREVDTFWIQKGFQSAKSLRKRSKNTGETFFQMMHKNYLEYYNRKAGTKRTGIAFNGYSQSDMEKIYG